MIYFRVVENKDGSAGQSFFSSSRWKQQLLVGFALLFMSVTSCCVNMQSRVDSVITAGTCQSATPAVGRSNARRSSCSASRTAECRYVPTKTPGQTYSRYVNVPLPLITSPVSVSAFCFFLFFWLSVTFFLLPFLETEKPKCFHTSDFKHILQTSPSTLLLFYRISVNKQSTKDDGGQ